MNSVYGRFSRRQFDNIQTKKRRIFGGFAEKRLSTTPNQ